MEQPSPMPPGDVYQAELVTESQPRRKFPLSGLIIILFMIGIVVVPLIAVWVPEEVARWRMAAAEEQRLEGDLTGAIERLDRVIERRPRQADLYLQRAEWHRQNQDYARALKDCSQAIELDPDDSDAYLLRSQIRQHQGEFARGVEDLQLALELEEVGRSSFRRAQLLKGVAYARALADQDLDEALAEVQEALELIGDNAAMLDTRGFVYYRRGEWQAAQEDLDRAVQLIETDLETGEQALGGEQLGVVDTREAQLQFRQLKQSVAVIRYHRALVRDALNEADAAEEDRQRVRELGFEPTPDLF